MNIEPFIALCHTSGTHHSNLLQLYIEPSTVASPSPELTRTISSFFGATLSLSLSLSSLLSSSSSEKEISMRSEMREAEVAGAGRARARRVPWRAHLHGTIIVLSQWHHGGYTKTPIDTHGRKP